MISISRNNQYSLVFSKNLGNKIKRLNNYSILESYGSIKNICKYYFNSLENKKNIYEKLCKLYDNDFLSKLLSYGILIIEEPKNKVFEKNIYEFNKINKINKVINSIPEFIDGRLINNFFNSIKVKTYSIQHSSIGVLQSSRFIYMINFLMKLNKNYVPKILMVEFFIKKNMRDLKNIKIVGNPRININKFFKKNNKNIYYICEMHNLNLLKSKINKILSIFPDKNLFIRLHQEKLISKKK